MCTQKHLYICKQMQIKYKCWHRSSYAHVWLYPQINAHWGKNTCTHIHANPRPSLSLPQLLFSLSKGYPVATHTLSLLSWNSNTHR
jgi:hypothetical protein